MFCQKCNWSALLARAIQTNYAWIRFIACIVSFAHTTQPLLLDLHKHAARQANQQITAAVLIDSGRSLEFANTLIDPFSVVTIISTAMYSFEAVSQLRLLEASCNSGIIRRSRLIVFACTACGRSLSVSPVVCSVCTNTRLRIHGSYYAIARPLSWPTLVIIMLIIFNQKPFVTAVGVQCSLSRLLECEGAGIHENAAHCN